MKRVIWLFCLLYITDVCRSQAVYQSEVFSLINNQAALVKQKNLSIGVCAVNRFMLPSLNSYTVVANIPLQSDHFGLLLDYYTFNRYKDGKIGLAYARKLTDKLDAGVQFNYTTIGIAGYGKASAISFEAGTIFYVSEEFQTGFHIANPVTGKFGKTREEKLPSIYKLSFRYNVSKQFFTGIEIVKEELRPVYLNTGVYYSIDPSLIIKGGIYSYATIPWIGAGLCWRSLGVDVSIAMHPRLGPISTFTFSYEIKRKEE